MSASALPLPDTIRRNATRLATLAAASLLAGCSGMGLISSRPAEAPAPRKAEPPPVAAPAAPPAAIAAPLPEPAAAAPVASRPRPSGASDPRAYRADGARHLYQANRHRIYSGRLPPMLYAVGVLDVEVGSQGEVRGLNWQRAPRHAPEVIAEIERTVRAAAPFPAPARMGRVVYTDVWLWDRSGRFQLDTLTEGQH